MGKIQKMLGRAVVGSAMALVGLFSANVQAADHGDAPLIANDQACDIADVYVFLDPADNSKMVIIATFRGFITSGENANFGVFDPNVRHRFLVENTDDAAPDGFIDVRFSRKTVAADPQIATVKVLDRPAFTAPATVSTIAAQANAPVITTADGIEFFAGLVDDPFFFDIPGFSRFSASIRAGSPDPTQLNRGRDSFAGYNLLAIAMRMDVDVLKRDPDTVGVAFAAQRRKQRRLADGTFELSGPWQTIDRMGNPAVNVVLLPFPRKNAHNQGTPEHDARGRFLPFIAETLEVFGVDETSTAVLAQVAIQKGDYVRLDTTIRNRGEGGGGDDGGRAGFPNGRRLRDDVVDILSFFLNNRRTLGDSVPRNDVPLRNTFPFVAPPQQPRGTGVIDDNTRN